MMRVTLNLPDDVYRAAQSLARLRGISLGEALGELVRRGLPSSPPLAESKPFPCFRLRDDVEPITLEQTLNAEG
jgi:hypothetical protein